MQSMSPNPCAESPPSLPIPLAVSARQPGHLPRLPGSFSSGRHTVILPQGRQKGFLPFATGSFRQPLSAHCHLRRPQVLSNSGSTLDNLHKTPYSCGRPTYLRPTRLVDTVP